MKFRTEIIPGPSDFQIRYNDPVMLIGSCFTEYIGSRLREKHFSTDINPFGVVYNPISVKRSLELLMNGKHYTNEDLEYYNEKYFSWDHHSDFSGTEADKTLYKINYKIQSSSSFLKKAKYLFISMGTAWVYRLKKKGRIVSNCHKMPANNFTRELLTVDYIASEYYELIQNLKKINPNLKIIFTVSPIRHWKDGAHGNQISKSILHLSIHQIQDKCAEDADYFPSYEILLDDLRDYRFYGEDLIHPNQQAIDYIWEKFIESYFNETTKSQLIEIEKLVKASRHRFFDPESRESFKFRENQKRKLEQIKKVLPFVDFSNLSKAFEE
ncbi:MAG: GSCFA domain-containing protein [Bacteroidota bacterium]